MSFALIVKQELVTNKYSVEETKAFISGIISTTDFATKIYKLIINNKQLINLCRQLLTKNGIQFISEKNEINLINFKYQTDFRKIKFISYYLAGVFFGTGSISKLDATSYHLEIAFYDQGIAQNILEFLNTRNFDFHLIPRRKQWVIYLKKSNQIADFLKTIQAHQSLMIFEDQRIMRDFNNHLNRYSNLDTYNMRKVATANLQFQQLYKELKSKKLLDLFSAKELQFFHLKINHPYISLQELAVLYAKKYGVKITKSALNHYLIKMKKILQDSKI